MRLRGTLISAILAQCVVLFPDPMCLLHGYWPMLILCMEKITKPKFDISRIIGTGRQKGLAWPARAMQCQSIGGLKYQARARL